MTIAVVFPGQGSQQPGAGQTWKDQPAWAIVERAELVLGIPLAPLLLDADADLSRTRESQLGVLMASLLAWEAVQRSLRSPARFAGHSLGQITALIAGGAVSFEDGIRFAVARAEASQRAADRRPGAMVALLGATLEQAETACLAAPGEAWIANLNAPGQVVVGGTPEGMAAVAAAAPEVGIRRQRALAVGGAFHTPLMAQAADDLTEVLASTTFYAPGAPITTNHDAVDHADESGWPERLKAHLVQPVRWQASVEAMVAGGVDHIVEVGPGTTLTSLVTRIAPEVQITNVATPEDAEALAAEQPAEVSR